MAIIKQYHKDTDTTYVYESISYWDETKKQSRSQRRVIGKIDPQTGEIIPTGKRGRKPREKQEPSASKEMQDPRLSQLYEESRARITELELRLAQREDEVKKLTAVNNRLLDIIVQTRKQLIQCTALMEEAQEQ